MKKFTTIFCVSVFVAVFLFMFIFTVFLPRTEISDYSILKEWPKFSLESLFSGEYFSDVIYCFTDTINSRDRFIDFETKINDLYGIKDDEQLYVVYEESDISTDDITSENEDFTEESNTSMNESSEISDISESSLPNSEDESSISVENDEPNEDSSDFSEDTPEDVNPEMSGTILIVGTRAIELYGGNTSGAERYAKILSEFADRLDKNVTVYSMVIPKASAYYVEQAKGYEGYIYRNKRDIDTISNNLSEKVIDVNIYNALGMHADEEIYFRTDTHWSALGAYYGAEVFAEKAGIAFDSLSEYTETRREGYIGVMYKYSDYNSRILNNPEYFPIYRPNTEYDVYYFSKDSFDEKPLTIDKNSDGLPDYDGFFWNISDSQRSSWYSTFICGDNYAVKAVSKECKNGRKLLIVKDSYGNALAPFLIKGFEEIYIIDAREYNVLLSDTIEKFGITDVLFAECTFSAVGKYLNFLEELCS